MSAESTGKLLASTCLVAAAGMSRSIGVPQIALLLFGMLNVFLAPPGTVTVRIISILWALGGLLTTNGEAPAFMFFTAVMVWPPLFLTVWVFGREHAEAAARGEPRCGPPRSRTAVAAIIAALAISVLAYRGIFAAGLQQTAMLFVGLPALLAITVILFSAPRSATGLACTVVTVGLLVSLIFLGEGMLCVLMSAPIFYGVAIGIARVWDRDREMERTGRIVFSSSAILVIALISTEGVTESWSLNREQTVTATRIVHASADDVARAVLEPPRFDRVMPLTLRAGFPRPTAVRIDDKRWTVRMRGGEMRLDGMEPRAGDLVLELSESANGLVRWTAVSDDSHMTHFLRWRGATVEWHALDGVTTQVTWTLHYERGLDPSWYFGPWERFVAGMAAGYLIDAVATP